MFLLLNNYLEVNYLEVNLTNEMNIWCHVTML